MPKPNLIKFEEVQPNESQAKVLYELLKIRQHSISHEDLPKYEEHIKFVLDHPYRKWYLIKNQNECLGTFYLSHENSIGLNIKTQHIANVLHRVINFVIKNFQPLPEILSIRPKNFTINVPFDHDALANSLQDLGYYPIQKTFKIV